MSATYPSGNLAPKAPKRAKRRPRKCPAPQPRKVVYIPRMPVTRKDVAQDKVIEDLRKNFNSRLDEAEKRLSGKSVRLNPEELAVLETVRNPFGKDHKNGPWSLRGNLPNERVYLQKRIICTKEVNLAPGAIAYMYVEAKYPDSNSATLVERVHGADDNLGTSLGNKVPYVAENWAEILATTTATSRAEHLVLALKINITNSTGVTKATIRAGKTVDSFRTATDTYLTNTRFQTSFTEVISPLPNGTHPGATIKVCYSDSLGLATLPTTDYADHTLEKPYVWITGLQSTDEVIVKAVYHGVQEITNTRLLTTPVDDPNESPNWPTLKHLLQDENHRWITHGHSFRSLYRDLAQSGRYIWNVGSKVVEVLLKPETLAVVKDFTDVIVPLIAL